MAFDPNDPNLLTPEKKLYNVKKKVNEIHRQLSVEEEHAESEEELRLIHMMKVVLAEINRELDRSI